jgi:hypothetical protein
MVIAAHVLGYVIRISCSANDLDILRLLPPVHATYLRSSSTERPLFMSFFLLLLALGLFLLLF